MMRSESLLLQQQGILKMRSATAVHWNTREDTFQIPTKDIKTMLNAYRLLRMDINKNVCLNGI